jgi:hypothetical protein
MLSMKNSILGGFVIRLIIIVILFLLFLCYNFLFENYTNILLMTLKDVYPVALSVIPGTYILNWILKKRS